METQRSLSAAAFLAVSLLAGVGSIGWTQEASRPQAPVQPVRPRVAIPEGAQAESVVLNAIRSHPLTAPYPISATWQNGAIVLSGVVGTKQVHDAAVRIVIDTGVPFRDNLVIDTAGSHLAALSATMAVGGNRSLFGPAGSYSPYVYPPPLFARLDDPFFGFVPPLVSFPPWWRRSPDSIPRPRPAPLPPQYAQPGVVAPQAGAASMAAPAAGRAGPDETPIKGQVELTVDSAGQIFLRGVVASEEAAREIIEAARSVPGVSRVESDLQVVPRRADVTEAPPPPPEPAIKPPTFEPPNAQPAPEPAGKPSMPAPADRPPAPDRGAATPASGRPKPEPGPTALDAQNLTQRVLAGLKRRSVIADLPVKIRTLDGAVTLSGEVPSAYEAMLVYRSAEQTPGVREIIDRLEFVMPDEDHPNPLLRKGRPEDLEPYLAAQIRRHVGDLAHVDRVKAQGDVIEVYGTLLETRDRDRIMAILRSIPLLQGFRLEPDFKADE